MQKNRTEAERRAQAIQASLVVRPNTAGEPIWSGVWRDSGKRRMMRTVGPAWLVKRPRLRNPFIEGDEGRERKHEPKAQESWRMKWEKRSGRVKDGALDERMAQAAVRDLVLARELELLEEARAAHSGPKTFAQLVEVWLAERQAEVQDGELKPSTYRDYQAMLAAADAPVRKHGNARKGHVLKDFGNRPVDAITDADLEAFGRKLRAEGLSVATRKKYKTVLRMLLDFAVARGVIEKNPMSKQRQKRRKAQEKVLSVYALPTVERIAQEAGGMDGELIRLAALTGMRQGELVALRWSSVDFIGRKITIERNYVEGLGEGTAKSGRARTVPLSDQAAVVLDRVSRRERFTKKADLVFTSDRGGHIDASALRRRYAKARGAVIEAAAKEGDAVPVARFHDLRHTFGTRCAAAGVPLSDLQALMGHANIATTMIYVHYLPQHDAADRLSRAFDEGTVEEVVLEAVAA